MPTRPSDPDPGFALPPSLERPWPRLPLIVLLALANSFAEDVAS